MVIAGALALRLPQLDRRPMHTDESVHAIKFQGLWEKGAYAYDPNEFHGPSLYYATLPFAWLNGAANFAELREFTLRLVPVAFGLGTDSAAAAPRGRPGLSAGPVGGGC